MNYSSGTGAVNAATGAKLGDDSELDLTVDLRWGDPERGSFTVPWLRLRAGFLNFGSGRSHTQVRAILNWYIPAL